MQMGKEEEEELAAAERSLAGVGRMLRCKQKWRRESKQGRVIFGSPPPIQLASKRTHPRKQHCYAC